MSEPQVLREYSQCVHYTGITADMLVFDICELFGV